MACKEYQSGSVGLAASGPEQFKDRGDVPAEGVEVSAELLQPVAVALLGALDGVELSADLLQPSAVALLGGLDGVEHVVERADVVVELTDLASQVRGWRHAHGHEGYRLGDQRSEPLGGGQRRAVGAVTFW